jgi:hypothetical protein
MQDARQYAPATLRNREAILETLLQILPPTGNILEISSGTGEHAVYFAPHLQPRQWIPTDPNPIAISSINAWQKYHPSPNLLAPLAIDVTEPDWQRHPQLQNQDIQAIVNINMIHIAPWAACLGLMSGANKILPEGGLLYLYGAYKQNGKHTAPSNADFDANLRNQNPEWGVRDLNEVMAVSSQQNLVLKTVQPMPANNLSVIFQKISNQNPK